MGDSGSSPSTIRRSSGSAAAMRRFFEDALRWNAVVPPTMERVRLR